MPNYCNNFITITGDIDAISKIKAILEDPNVDTVFHPLVGIPTGMSEQEYRDNWYNTNIDFWGTKWDVRVEDSNIEFESDCITMSPDTAWSPPIGFARELHSKFGVDVEIEYSESGCDFAGKFIIDSDGECDECYGYMEGLYRFDVDLFWFEFTDRLKYMFADGDSTSLEQILEEHSFLDKDDIEEATKIYNEQIELAN